MDRAGTGEADPLGDLAEARRLTTLDYRGFDRLEDGLLPCTEGSVTGHAGLPCSAARTDLWSAIRAAEARPFLVPQNGCHQTRADNCSSRRRRAVFSTGLKVLSAR